MEDSEGTVKQIGAFSEEINNLTVRHLLTGQTAGIYVNNKSKVCTHLGQNMKIDDGSHEKMQHPWNRGG